MAYVNFKSEHPTYKKSVHVDETAAEAARIIEDAEARKLKFAQLTRRREPFFLDVKLISGVATR